MQQPPRQSADLQRLPDQSVAVKARRRGLDRLAIWLIAFTVLFLVLAVSKLFFPRENPQSATAPGPPFTDFRSEKPGAVHKITAKDLPAPYATCFGTQLAAHC